MKRITKKSLQALDKYRNIGDGTRLTEKETKEISVAFAKHRAQRKGKKAA